MKNVVQQVVFNSKATVAAIVSLLLVDAGFGILFDRLSAPDAPDSPDSSNDAPEAPDAPNDVHVPFNEAKALAMLDRIITKPAVECEVDLGKCTKETDITRLRNNALGLAVSQMGRLRKECMSWVVPSGDISGIFFSRPASRRLHARQ